MHRTYLPIVPWRKDYPYATITVMLKAIIFDCYDVLYIPSGPEYFTTLVASHPQYATQIQDLGKQSDYGFISLDDLAQGIAQLVDAEPAAVKKGLEGGHVHNLPLLNYIKRLRPQFKTGLVSNMSADSLGSIFTQAQLTELFNTVIISGQVGMIKPSPDIFLLAAHRLNVDTSECLFIDDQPANCDGAQAVGMQATVYKGFDALVGELVSFGVVAA